MATQRYVSTSFWDDKWIRSLNPSDRYLYLYLMTNPLTNIAGVYEITIDRIAFDTGYDERTLRPMLDRFARDGKAFFYQGEWMILPTWPKHQKWEKSSKIRKGIASLLKTLPTDLLSYMVQIGYRYPIDTLSIPYTYPSNLDFKESCPLIPPLSPPLDNLPLSPPYNPPSKKGDYIAREATQDGAIETLKKSQKPVVSDEEAKALVGRFTKNDEYAKSLMVFVGHRRDIKKPMTPLALEQMLKLLDKKLDTDQERIDCLELSIANGWQGVFPNRIQMQNNSIRGRPNQRTLNRYGTEPGGLGVKDYMGGDDDEK